MRRVHFPRYGDWRHGRPFGWSDAVESSYVAQADVELAAEGVWGRSCPLLPSACWSKSCTVPGVGETVASTWVNYPGCMRLLVRASCGGRAASVAELRLVVWESLRVLVWELEQTDTCPADRGQLFPLPRARVPVHANQSIIAGAADFYRRICIHGICRIILLVAVTWRLKFRPIVAK